MEPKASVIWNRGGEERIPRSFGRLWLLRQLARGGMGEVYLAATSGIEGAERPCVVKIIRRDRAADQSFVARFLDEARVQAQLQHPGVAQVLEASIDAAGEPYVVVEYVEGRSLAEVRARALHMGARFEWSDAVAIGTSAAEALGHVHERTDSAGRALGIVHRDLSPQNVMIGYGGDLKLIDFGTARAENRRCHTISGVVFAKPGYVAPEVAGGVSGDLRVDLYALGVILWELVAGRRFLEGAPSEHLALVAKDERTPGPVASLAGAPPALDRIIGRLTAHRPEDRYTSGKQAASDLARLMADAPGLPSGERSVRARIASLMSRLFPSEPAKSRADFAALVKAARWASSDERSGAPAAAVAAATHTEGSPATGGSGTEGSESSPLAGALLEGTRYRLLRTIGRGAMGVVYEAEHVDLARRVALKVLSAEASASPAAGAALRREAQAVARLCQPNLVMVHDFGQAQGGRAYFAMELLRGETLEQRFAREGRLDWREAAALGIDACRGLEAAHAAGLVHCDLKPANLFLSHGARQDDAEFAGVEPPTLKILDFGIARTPSEPSDLVQDQGQFALAGTPEYMAPEQAEPGPVDGRADVYALASVLYELCTGRLPFIAPSAALLFEKKSKSAPEPMRARSSALELPAALDRALMKALAPRPGDRFDGAAAFRRALEDVVWRPHERRAASRAAGYAAIGAAAVFAVVLFASRRPALVERLSTSVSPPPRSLEPALAPPAALATVPVVEATTPSSPIHANARPRAQDEIPRRARDETPRGAEDEPRSFVEKNRGTGRALARAVDAAPPADPHARAPAKDDLSAALAAEASTLEQGSSAEALVVARELARSHPREPRVLRAWAEAAAAARDWREAIEASEAWSLADMAGDARLHLARMLAYAGRRVSAARILEELLEAHPECDEARALLSELHDEEPAPLPEPASAERAHAALAPP